MLRHYLSSHGNYKVKQLQKVKRNTTLNLQLFFPYTIICLNVCNGNFPIGHVLSHWIPLIFAQQDSKTEVLDLLSSYLCFTRKANRNERCLWASPIPQTVRIARQRRCIIKIKRQLLSPWGWRKGYFTHYTSFLSCFVLVGK